MYARQFGLSQDPFSIAPDPRFLFMSERHREALAHLLFGVTGAGGGFVLLTGEIGTGKTTICRCFLEQIPSGCHVAYVFNPKLSALELLQSICEEFHIPLSPTVAQAPTVKVHVDALNAFLLQSHATGQNCVLVIDEAQNLAPDVLEQLRLLTNLETAERKLLQIVLIGQPELRTLLASPALEQLAQRVIARYHLEALTPDETLQYIAHRMAVAGQTGRLPFDDAALQRIHQLTKGVPRCINLLCGRALLGAWANGPSHVSKRVVEKAATEVFGATHLPYAAQDSAAFAWVAMAVLCIFAAVAGALWWASPPQVLPAPTLAVPDPVASAAMPLSSGASTTVITETAREPGRQLASVEAIEDLEPLLLLLPRDINRAWHELASVWKLPTVEGDPCDAARIAPLQCHRSTKLNVLRLRQLNRPSILVLQKGPSAPVHAVLVGLNDQTATLILGGMHHTVRWVHLSQLWQGGFATYWRAPIGYGAELQPGTNGPAVVQLAEQLAKVDGIPMESDGEPKQRFDDALKARVTAFQKAHGMRPDGVPGALTFMQLESTTDSMNPVDPRLAR
jgi:general secretion pathway protein A